MSLKHDFKPIQPLLLNHKGANILYPSSAGVIKLRINEKAQIACPGSSVFVNGQNYGINLLEIKCSQNNQFQIANNVLIIKSINCGSKLVAQLQNAGEERGYIKIAVRFPVGELSPQIVHYFDYKSKATAYSMYSIVSTVKTQMNCWQSSYFTEDQFYEDLGDYMNDIYPKDKQRQTINSLVGLPLKSTKYIQDTGEMYLAKGHLAANCDFVYEAQQQATYYYVNVAPQWQTFNNGNWKRLENSLRNYADRNGVSLYIISGTLGVASLRHERTKVDTKLYLSVNSGWKAVPVPKFFWKLAFDLRYNKGAVFIGTNNPYQQNIEFICNDVSDQMLWLSWEKMNQTKGYSYACSISDFLRVVRYLPASLHATGGLLT